MDVETIMSRWIDKPDMALRLLMTLERSDEVEAAMNEICSRGSRLRRDTKALLKHYRNAKSVEGPGQ